ncbi:MAG: hypothetical protein COT81_04920 [Candidatus Buchananbacteria bacterium CG10_big_fil_rev_8_21_14_0_10_42_9]|uniref:Uncharacterized protein n=1 Tax=Candidatus Buchananbacteria bacterium CG10_big_fil_rev_8_21_14_0_10_42_9 TaxID=1974526 RepID=A0A2H0W054_9BACT|nr:MAG: hypothetical protein COT81_04920 [Candidatus Buchananbacteria bacterium CG10_big_fil_rev_8_21_14_0_10_42_9]
MSKPQFILLSFLVVLSGCSLIFSSNTSPVNESPTNQSIDISTKNVDPVQKIEPDWQKVNSNSIPQAASAFSLSLSIPKNWAVESVPAIEAINFYDPQAPGENNLDKSQNIFTLFSR